MRQGAFSFSTFFRARRKLPTFGPVVVHYDMKGTLRSDIRIGMQVKIVLKKDQRSGLLTEGVVKDILTRSPNHPHGIKVRLEDGQVGRVKEIPDHPNPG